MKPGKAILLIAGAFLLAAGPSFAGDLQVDEDGWTQDYAAAKAQAKADGKDLLLDFTGSDWCGWCKRLHKEVFGTDEFKAAINDHFILVKLDFPKNKDLVTDEVREQNDRLQKEFPVRGFPTIFLTDAEGLPYAQTGYQEGGAEVYLKHLDEFRADRAKRDEVFARADAATGQERARLLDEALEMTSETLLLPFYASFVDEIMKLDADNGEGLRLKYAGLLMERDFDALADGGDWDEAIEAMDKAVETYGSDPLIVHRADFFKAIANIEKGSLEKGIELLEKAQEADPQGKFARYIPRIIQDVRSRMGDDDEEEEMEEEDDDGGDNG